MTAVGLGLIIGSWCVLLGGLGWLLLTWLWSIDEGSRPAERFGEQYESYRDATPKMIPNRARLLGLRRRIEGARRDARR